jgi:AmiR/NasT family two-component response regulator
VGLQAALDSRAMIDMAKGKLMALNDISPDEAFALLVRASQRENIKVRDIARRIVEGSRDEAEGAPAP